MSPSIPVAKAFNTAFAQFFAEPPTPAATLVYSGDDEAAKVVVAGWINDACCQPVDAGGSEATALVEAFAKLVIRIAYRPGGTGPFVYRFETP